jgi:DNA-directed RNA polymerase subunit RPC12/RpoP
MITTKKHECIICGKEFKRYLNKTCSGIDSKSLGPASWIPDEGVMIFFLGKANYFCNRCWDKIFKKIVREIKHDNA